MAIIPFSVFFILLFLAHTASVLETNAAKLNEPVVTKHINDISGPDVFKTTVGITNVGVNTGFIEICVDTTQSDTKKTCSVFDAGREFLDDFGNSTCSTCIITVGTFVFPAEKVPIKAVVTACASIIPKDDAGYSCDTTQNKQDAVPEDIVIRIN